MNTFFTFCKSLLFSFFVIHFTECCTIILPPAKSTVTIIRFIIRTIWTCWNVKYSSCLNSVQFLTLSNDYSFLIIFLHILFNGYTWTFFHPARYIFKFFCLLLCAAFVSISFVITDSFLPFYTPSTRTITIAIVFPCTPFTVGLYIDCMKKWLIKLHIRFNNMNWNN